MAGLETHYGAHDIEHRILAALRTAGLNPDKRMSPVELAAPVQALDRNKAHVRSGDRFADGSGVGRVVLAAFARQAIGRNELGSHQANGMSKRLEQACPMMGARASLHANDARSKRGDQLGQLATGHGRSNQHRFACGVYAMHSKHVLGEIDSNGNNSHETSPSTKRVS